MQITIIQELLHTWGARLRAARLERDDSMAIFAERLGISEGTLRAMERGSPTVQIGAWLNALWLLDQLHVLNAVLEPNESLFDQLDAAKQPRKQRASRRPR